MFDLHTSVQSFATPVPSCASTSLKTSQVEVDRRGHSLAERKQRSLTIWKHMECRRPFRESVQSQCKVHLPRLLTWKPVNFLNCHVNVTPNLFLPLEISLLAYGQAAWLVHLGPVRCHRSSASLRRGPLPPRQCVLVWSFISSVPSSTSLRWQELRAAAEDVQVASET